MDTMDNAEHRILDYPHLSADEQQDVDQFVAAHPEWAALLRDVRQLEALAADARLLSGKEAPAGEARDAVLAYYAVAQRFDMTPRSDALADRFRQIEQAVERDEALRERLAAVEERLDAGFDAVDPVAQFERLSGHALREVGGVESAGDTEPTEEADAEKPPLAENERLSGRRSANETPRNETPRSAGAAGGEARRAASRDASTDRAADRPAQAPPRQRSARRWVQWGAAAVLVVAVAYGVLFAASRATETTAERLAAVEVSTSMMESYPRLRSGTPSADTVDTQEQYLQALQLLREARRSTLGLFPRYDAGRLVAAEERLRRVIEREDPGTFLMLEARFFLAKTLLAQGGVDAARAQLKRVVTQDGPHAQESTRILTELQRAYPAQDPAAAE